MAEVNNEIKNKRRLVNVKSNLKGKTPTVNDITYGEIAVNYAKGAEFLSMKNEDQKIVTFDRAIEYGKNVKDEANPSNNINYKSVALRDSQTRDNGSTSTADFTSAMVMRFKPRTRVRWVSVPLTRRKMVFCSLSAMVHQVLLVPTLLKLLLTAV